MFAMNAIQNKTLRTEDWTEPHAGDGTIKIMQEHDRTSVPYVCAICQEFYFGWSNCLFVIIMGAVMQRIYIETRLKSAL